MFIFHFIFSFVSLVSRSDPEVCENADPATVAKYGCDQLDLADPLFGALRDDGARQSAGLVGGWLGLKMKQTSNDEMLVLDIFNSGHSTFS